MPGLRHALPWRRSDENPFTPDLSRAPCGCSRVGCHHGSGTAVAGLSATNVCALPCPKPEGGKGFSNEACTEVWLFCPTKLPTKT